MTGPDNNALERTRRVGVPASRAVVKSLALPLNAVFDGRLQGTKGPSMKTCSQCGMLNTDVASVCDCGTSLREASGGAGNERVDYDRDVPSSVWMYLALFAVQLLFRAYGLVQSRPSSHFGPPETHWQVEVIGEVIARGICVALVVPLLAKKNWARIALGILTLPLGVILFVSKDARRFTGALGPADGSGSIFGPRDSRSND